MGAAGDDVSGAMPVRKSVKHRSMFAVQGKVRERMS